MSTDVRGERHRRRSAVVAVEASHAGELLECV